MHKRFFCLLTLVAVLAGCKKPAQPADNPAAAPAKPVTIDSAPAPDAPPPAPGATPAPAEQPGDTPTDLSVNITYLNQTIADFYSAEMRVPKDLNELVKGGYAKSLPTPPAGKKFVIDPKTRTVQVVTK